jgi:anti-sigma factor RsiW
VTADHPTLDTLADYLAGLQPFDEAGEVASHLATCASCSATAEAVRQVPNILAAAASVSPTMPESVRHDLDDALRREADTRTGPAETLAGRRTAKRSAIGRRVAGSLLAAAAVVVAIAGGVQLASNRDDSNSASAGSAAAGDTSVGSAAGGETSEAGPSPENQPVAKHPDERRLSPRNLTGYAHRLTATMTGQSATKFAKLTADCATPERSPSDIVTVSRWEGAPAVVVVHPRAHRVQVLDCRTASVLLYATSY